MTKAGNINKGAFLNWQGEPVLVVEKEFSYLGRGSANIRLKLKNLKTGRVVRQVLKTDKGVEEIEVEQKKVQFLYRSGSQLVFVNPRSYEQIEVDSSVAEGKEKYLKEGESYQASLWQGQLVSIALPKKMVFQVVKAEKAVKGDTATGATKLVTLETGLTVKVPLFIKQGENIIVSTETGEYLSREK